MGSMAFFTSSPPILTLDLPGRTSACGKAGIRAVSAVCLGRTRVRICILFVTWFIGTDGYLYIKWSLYAYCLAALGPVHA